MNELARRFAETTQPRAERFLLTALGGILLGCLVLVILRFPAKFHYHLIAGPVILFIATVSGRFKRFFQGVLIFIIPLNYNTHFFRRPYRIGSTGVAFSPVDIILIVLYAVWFYELIIKKSGSFNFFPRITIPALSLVGICALSMFKASDPYLTLFETIRLFKVVLLYFYVANHFRSKRDISFALVLLLIGLFLQCLIAYSQRWLGMSLGLGLFGEYQEMVTYTQDYYLVTSRVGGTLGHPNNLAKYVELLIPISMTLLFTGIRLRLKLAAAVVSLCSFIVLLLTMSRGGWVCFTGSMALIFLLIFRAKLISLRTLVALGVVAVIFGSVLLVFSGMVGSRLFSDDYGAAYSRIPLNKIAFAAIRANPFLGVGSLNLWKVTYLYNPNVGWIKPNQVVHNEYLLRAAETGILGLIILLWLLSAIAVWALRNIKNMKDTFLVCVNIGLLAGMAALWAHWLVDPGYIARAILMWVLVGFMVGSTKADEDILKMPSGKREFPST